MKDEIIQKIKELGVPEQEVENLYNLLSEQILDLLFEDLSEQLSDDELGVIENRIKEAKSPEHFETIIKELAFTTYGDNAPTEINNMYLDLIDTFKKNVEETKSLIQRANSGDPEAQQVLEKAKETDLYKEITTQSEE